MGLFRVKLLKGKGIGLIGAMRFWSNLFVDDQYVVPIRLVALMRSGLWKSWKAEVRFPLSHTPGYDDKNVNHKPKNKNPKTRTNV
jgi:hypothetical protein